MKKNRRNLPLTEAQAKVHALLQEGLTNREIAETLNRSEHTVKRHVEQVLAKTGAKRRWQLIDREKATTFDD